MSEPWFILTPLPRGQGLPLARKKERPIIATLSSIVLSGRLRRAQGTAEKSR